MSACACGFCSVSYKHCAQCGYVRYRVEMLRVTDLRTGQVRHVCRPTDSGLCFSQNVRGADLDAIEYGASERQRARREREAVA